MAATPTHVSLAAGVVVDVHETLAIAERAGANTGDCRDWELERIVVAGDVLPDRYDKWTVFERERFRQTRLQARESLCDDLRRQKRYDKGLDVGLAAIASEPLRESTHCAVMRVHLTEGNVAEAFQPQGLARGAGTDDPLGEETD
jgi:DNA-binding SARP family transcriptional activator